MTVKEMQIIRTTEIIKGGPMKEKILLKVDPLDTAWQDTSLGRIRTGDLKISGDGRHVSLPIEYEPATLGEKGQKIRTRNIQLDKNGKGKDPLGSSKEAKERVLYVDIGCELPKPIPPVLRPYEV